jgi:TPR repeat protein
MYELGKLYLYGLDVAQDYEQARDWYKKAAEAGHPDAKQALRLWFLKKALYFLGIRRLSD